MAFSRMVTLTVGALSLAAAIPASAQTQFPTKPIRIIVPFPAGSTGEVIGRQIADSLTKRIGQPVVIEARAGAAGAIGTQAVANAAPDGHTILFHSSSIVLNQVTMPDQVDVVKGLAPLTPAIFGIMGIFTHPSIPAKNVAELIQYVKARPGKINYGSAGQGSQTHLYGVLFAQAAGIDMAHIPYNGGAPAMVAAVSNEVQMLVIDTFTAKPQSDAGKLNHLAVASKQRLARLPNVPTVDESGLPGYFADFWFAFFAPPATPTAILDKLNAEINAVLKEPDMIKKLNDQGYEVEGQSRAAFTALLNSDIDKWKKAVAGTKN